MNPPKDAPDLVVGQTYTAAEIGGLAGNAAITGDDRIVTEELAWTRMTVRRLTEWLSAAHDSGEIDDDTIIFVDSDPEGNGLHPMRAAASLVAVGPDGSMDEEATEVTLPAKAVWFGVGY